MKPVEQRNTQPNQIVARNNADYVRPVNSHDGGVDDDNDQIDIFEIMIGNDNDGTDYESAVEDLDGELNANINDQWCGIDQRNIINARTRSGLLGEGDG